MDHVHFEVVILPIDSVLRGSVKVELVQVPFVDIACLVVCAVGCQDSVSVSCSHLHVMSSNGNIGLENVRNCELNVGVNKGVKGLVVDLRIVVLDITDGQHVRRSSQGYW